MDFIRFYAVFDDGKIHDGELITVDLSNIFMKWFFAGFARVINI